MRFAADRYRYVSFPNKALPYLMWSYRQARDNLVSALRREADAQEQGRPEEVGAAFDVIVDHLPRNAGPEFGKIHQAISFWDAWRDARNHWRSYEPIQEQDWPRLARSIASQIEADQEVSEPLVLNRFGFRGHKSDTAP